MLACTIQYCGNNTKHTMKKRLGRRDCEDKNGKKHMGRRGLEDATWKKRLGRTEWEEENNHLKGNRKISKGNQKANRLESEGVL